MAAPSPVAVPTSELGYGRSGPVGWWDAPAEESTPELRWPNSVVVWDAMRRQDAQVASVLRAVTQPVLRTKWRINPAGARDEVSYQIAEDLGLQIKGQSDDEMPGLRRRDRFSWPTHVRMSLLSLPLGFMPFEQVCRIDAAGRVRLRKLAPRMPRSLAGIEVADDGGLVGIRQYGSANSRSAGPVLIPTSRLVMYCNDREGGNWYGQSLLRPAYKFWLLKDRLLRVQAQTIDRNGMGVPTYEAAASEKSLKAGEAIARGYRSGESAGAAIPNGAKLRLLGVEGALPDAMAPIRYYDEQIGRAVLAHFLNLGDKTGSWALGTTFADFFTLSLQSVADYICDVTNQHVIEDLVDWNWGPDEPAPRLEFDEIGSQNRATAEAIRALIDAGALTPSPALEEYLRQTYGLPGETLPARDPEES